MTKQPQIETAVAAVEAELKPQVRRIRWEISKDWSDDWGIFFRVLLSDSASSRSRLGRITSEVRKRLLEKLRPQELGLIAYYAFRSESEQAKLREKSWM